MHISSKAGTEIFKNEYQIIDSINGIPTLETDFSQLRHNHSEPLIMLSNAYEDKFIMIMKEQESVSESSRVRLTGVHSFIYDFSLDRIYEEYTQYFSLENALSMLFDDTEYSFEVKSDIYYYALDFQNFGDNDKISLLNQICDRWELEYHVTGNKVVFGQRRGKETTKQFRYKMNITDSSVNLDMSEGATYIRAAFGKKDDENPENSTYTEREMTHPLVDDFGIRHAKPYSNENITVEETMQRYMKMKIEETWKLSVEVDITDLIGDGQAEVGDTVWAIDERLNLEYKTRIIEIKRYYNKDDQIYRTEAVLGNKTFIEAVSDQEVTQSEMQDEVVRYTNQMIESLKADFDNDFNAARDEMRQLAQDAKDAALAEIQAAEQRMEALITTTRNDWTDTFNAEVAEIYRKADEDYNRIETEITGVIDSTREEMEMEFSDSVQNARDYAEQQAAEKATAVRTDLETVTSGHQGMIDDLQSSVLDIDDFLGSDRNVGLNEMLYNERIHMEERINSINTWHYNLLRETQSLDDEHWQALGGTLEFGDSGERYFKSSSSALVSRALESKESMLFETGETYTLTFQVQTYGHRSMDNIFIISTDADIYASNFDLDSNADVQTANVIHFGSEYRTYYITFTMPFDVYGKIRIGGDYRNNDLGAREYRIKKPYLTQSDNKQWLHNPEDSLQNIEEVTRRVTLLEDGREEFITRTQYDFETGEIEGTVRNILETVDGRESIIQNHEDWINTNGASVIESAEGFQSRAWLADIHNPNMLNFTNVTDSSHFNNWSLVGANLWGVSYAEWLMVRASNSTISYLGVYTPEFNVQAGQTVTYSFEAWENDNSIVDSTSGNMDYTFFTPEDGANQSIWLTQKRTRLGSINGTDYYRYYGTFTPEVTTSRGRLLIGTRRRSGTGQQDLRFRFRHPKLEIGDRVTPYYNAYSMLNQRADSISLQVDDQESRISTFTVDLDSISGTVADIEGDYIKQSSLEVTSDYAQIGSMQIDGDTVGSLLRVSPSGIDAVAEAMRLSGDLLVDGDVEAITGDFIEGNFARLWADEFEGILITADHIDTDTLEFSMISGTDALIDRLVAKSAFVDAIAGRELYFSDGTIGRLEASIIRANVIKSDHIEASTSLIDKMFANSARIDRLITKTHFVNEIKATSIDAVHADLRSVNSEIMDTNILKADWIQGGNALLDKVFANTAMFERMMAKSGFIATMSAITLDLHELTIWRPDGVAFVQNGMERFGHPVPLTHYIDNGVSWNGKIFETSLRATQTILIAPGEHAGRYYNLVVIGGAKYNNQWASTEIGVIIRVQNRPSGTSWGAYHEERFTVPRGGTNSLTINFPLGRPTYGAFLFTIEFRKIGGADSDVVNMRTGRSWVSA